MEPEFRARVQALANQGQIYTDKASWVQIGILHLVDIQEKIDSVELQQTLFEVALQKQFNDFGELMFALLQPTVYNKWKEEEKRKEEFRQEEDDKEYKELPTTMGPEEFEKFITEVDNLPPAEGDIDLMPGD